MALEGAGARRARRRRPGSRWRRRRRCGRRRGRGCSGRWWRGRPRRPRRTSSGHGRSASVDRSVHPDSSPSRATARLPCRLRVPTGWSKPSRQRTGGARRGSEVVGTPGAVCDRGARPGAQGAVLRPRRSSPWRPSSCGPGSGRWRAGSRRSPSRATSSPTRSSTSRSSCVRQRRREVRAFQNACRHRGVRLVEGQGNCESGFTCSVPRVVLRPGRRQHPHPDAQVVRPAQPRRPATSTSPRCGASCGAGARGSTSTTTPRRCGSASSRPPRSSTRGRSSRCAPSGGTPAGCP